MTPEIIITMGAAHIRHIERSSTRRIRKMVQSAMTDACDKARAQNAKPISSVDDLTTGSIGRWVGVFGRCLARSARREGISVVGGEMAQMPDSYAPGYVGVIVSVVALR